MTVRDPHGYRSIFYGALVVAILLVSVVAVGSTFLLITERAAR